MLRLKLFFWNIWLKIQFWYLIKFKGKELKYYKRWDRKREGWKLTFSDEFDTFELDRDKWRTDAYYGLRFHPGPISEGKPPREFYSDGAFEFTSTTIKLIANDSPKNVIYEGNEWTIPYQVGQIDSSNYFMQTHGYFEIRAKMPSSPGMWPAFWLASIMDWPPEIDIYEIYTGKKKGFQTFETNAHWKNKPGGKKRMKPKKHVAFDLSKNFFIYSCEWDEKTIKFYFQDRLVRVMKTPKSFIHPMHIIINNSVDDRYTDQHEFPNFYEVDYVRVYERVDI